MLSCKNISNLASNYIDKTLSPLMQMKMKMHLLMCNRCRAFVNQLKTTVSTLQKIKPPVPEDDFTNKQAEKLINIAKSIKLDPHKDAHGNKKE